MKKELVVIVTVLAFSGSFLLASYFRDHGLSLNMHINKSIHWLESLFGYTPKLNKASVHVEPTNTASTIIQFKPEQQYQHREVGQPISCKDTSLGEVKYKKVGEIYTWVDEKGIANFSSEPPQKGDFSIVSFAGEKVFDYFTLDLNTESLPYDFNQKLTLKLNKLFEVYGQLLDQSSLKKIDIKLKIYASQNSFNQLKAKYNMPADDTTPGFYSYITNQAYLLLADHESTMRTATHEATHAINRGIIGYSPQWLNEGLAEYSEYIEVTSEKTRIYPSKSWTRHNKISQPLLPLYTLLTATNKDWNSELRTNFYASSWAFIYFMMDNQQRKGMLAQIIKHEQQNLCNVINIEQIENIIGIPIKTLQIQFNRWVQLKLKSHPI